MRLLAGLCAFAISGNILAAAVQHDFGHHSLDASPLSQIWINTREPEWSPAWWAERTDLSDMQMAIWEGEDKVNWIHKPDDVSGMISGRAIKFRRFSKFHFTLPGARYLTIRFKDDLIRPGRVYNGNGEQIGTIGGQRDHRWKTEQLQGNLITPIRIGDNYSDALSGMITIDLMRISTDPDHEFPPDSDGYWPEPVENRHEDLGRTADFGDGDGPKFLWGIYSRQFYTANGKQDECGSGIYDSFALWARVKMNTIVHHGWNQNWDSRWQFYPNEAPWALPAVYVEMGLEEMLFHAECHGMKMIPNYLTDTRAYWLNEDGGNDKLVREFERLADKYRGHPALLAHNPVDEWDHEGVDYSKPHVVSQQYYTIFKENDPDTPVYMSLMGFMENTGWQVAQESADILANDKYCHEAKTNGFVDLSKGCKQAYDYMRDMWEEVGDSKYRVYIPNFGENDLPQFPLGKRMLNQQEQVFQTYTGIVAGAQGIIMFADVYPHKPDYPGVESAWKGLEQIGEELFGEKGIAEYLVPPSVTIEDGAACNSEAKALLRQLPDGTPMLIVVNFEPTTKQVTCAVNGLQDGVHEARFEGYTVESVGGAFTDEIEGFGRRVYMLSGDYDPTEPPEPPPIDPCDLFPQLPQCEDLPPPVDPCEEDPTLPECKPDICEEYPWLTECGGEGIDWCAIWPAIPGCEEPPIDPPPVVPSCGEDDSIERVTISADVKITEYEDCVSIQTDLPVAVLPGSRAE